MTTAFPPCFSHDNVPQPLGALDVGRWVPKTPGEPWPYRADRNLWHTIGVNYIRDDPYHAHAYGRCDAQNERVLYDWRPRTCTLRPMQGAAEDICTRRLLGRQALFVGDSTAAQLFLSFVLSINGQFGRNGVNTATFNSLTAQACGGELRLSFERADALLWDAGATPKLGCGCNGMMLHHAFHARAKTADVVVLGIGQHFAALIESTAPSHRHQMYTFITQSLNRTLSGLAAANPQANRIVVGASMPVPGCSRFARPSGVVNAITSGGEAAGSNKYALSWWHNARINVIARAVALENGASFIDVTQLSASRADDALGRFPQNATSRKPPVEDCVHYCMPGVVDVVAQLVYNALAAHVVPRPGRDEWWHVDNKTWMSMRGVAAAKLEGRNKVGTIRDSWWASPLMDDTNCTHLCT